MYKHIIFDLDGTLVDTIQDVTSSINYALKVMGFPAKTLAEVQQAIGPGKDHFLKYIFPDGEDTEVDGELFLDLFRKHYWDHCVDATKPFDGMSKVIHALENDFNLHVASNKPRPFIERILEGLHIKDKFKVIVGPEDVTAAKPHPEMIIQVLNRAGAKPNDTLFVGDTDNDMKAGRGAGVHLCAVKFGYGALDVLESYNPEYFIEKPEEILEIAMNHSTAREITHGS